MVVELRGAHARASQGALNCEKSARRVTESSDLMHFMVALVALGIGWNFLYIGGTTLFTQAYRVEEKTTAQVTMDSFVYATMALTSFFSGALITTLGWAWLYLGSIIPLASLGAGLVWLAMNRFGGAPSTVP